MRVRVARMWEGGDVSSAWRLSSINFLNFIQAKSTKIMAHVTFRYRHKCQPPRMWACVYSIAYCSGCAVKPLAGLFQDALSCRCHVDSHASCSNMSKTCRTHATSIDSASRLWRHSFRKNITEVQLPLSWSVIPMVPPVLMTRTRASVVEGEVSGSIDSSELQLDNFLHLDGCSGIFLGVPTSFVASTRFSCGCDKARARDVRLISAMMTTEVITRTGSAYSPACIQSVQNTMIFKYRGNSDTQRSSALVVCAETCFRFNSCDVEE